MKFCLVGAAVGLVIVFLMYVVVQVFCEDE